MAFSSSKVEAPQITGSLFGTASWAVSASWAPGGTSQGVVYQTAQSGTLFDVSIGTNFPSTRSIGGALQPGDLNVMIQNSNVGGVIISRSLHWIYKRSSTGSIPIANGGTGLPISTVDGNSWTLLLTSDDPIFGAYLAPAASSSVEGTPGSPYFSGSVKSGSIYYDVATQKHRVFKGLGNGGWQDLVTGGGGGGTTFPYTGSAIITGSLIVSQIASPHTNTASNGAFVVGDSVNVNGAGSSGIGSNLIVIGAAAFAQGYQNIANGTAAHAEGQGTTAKGTGTHAEGSSTTALGNYCHAEGTNTTALGNWSHAEGQFSTSIGQYSHAEGSGDSIGDYSHAEGASSSAVGQYSHAEGNSTTAIGQYSHAEGQNTRAIGANSHAEGQQSIASGSYSHCEGQLTTAGGNYSHTLGYQTIAVGQWSNAEGFSADAMGPYSHAEGNSTIAFGTGSHAEGDSTTAVGDWSHTVGKGTVANANHQMVVGMFNQLSDASGSFIVGSGTSNGVRKNVLFASGSEVQITGSLLISSASVVGEAVSNIGDTYTSTAKVTKMVTCTSAEYTAIGTKDPNTFYIVI